MESSLLLSLFFSTFWDIFRQAEGRGEAGYSTGATGLSGLRCNRTWKLHEPVFPAYPPLSRSLSPSPSRFPPDPASSYFARFPQMLIALFPNANSFLTSERRVYPAFLSLSPSLFSLFSLSSPHSFSHSRYLPATGSIHSPSPWAARTRLWNQVRESCR